MPKTKIVIERKKNKIPKISNDDRIFQVKL